MKPFIYHICRYKTDGETGISKIFTPVSTGKFQEDRIIATLFGRKYRLKSIFFRKGIGIHSGHFTSITNECNKWFFLNDSQVTCKDSYKQQAYKSADNYVLCYKLQDN